jgi:predicted permease
VYRQLLDRINALPGVRAAALSDFVPFSIGAERQRSISVQGFSPKPEDDLNPHVINVSPRFFDAMGIGVLKGRAFDARDEARASQIAIVSESFATYYFGADNPIGRRFGFGSQRESGDIEIVGVVKDVKLGDLREQPSHLVFVPTTFSPLNTVLVVSGDDAALIAPSVRREIQALDRTLPVVSVTTMRQQVEQSLGNERVTAWLSTCFGGVALLLACIGLYGVMAYTVSRRTKDVGVRIALGASSAAVVQMILRESLTLVLVGIAIGVPVALVLTFLISSRLFGVSPADPMTLAFAIMLLMGTAALAGWLPARRASQIDPMLALRHE